MAIYGNSSPSEGSTSGTVTITFPWRALRIIITNDSAIRDLEFKFNSSESYATLKPTETISLDLHARTVLLNSPSSGSVAYRVWGYG